MIESESSQDPTALSNPTQDGSGSLAGLLRACITVPHLLGTFVSRRIYLADDGHKVIAFASVRKTIRTRTVTTALGSQAHE